VASAFAARDDADLRLSALPQKPAEALALFAPSMLLIIGMSFVVSSLLLLLGKSDTVDVSGALLPQLLRHALLPAVFEEMLFRYLPLKILHPYSPRAALLLSALFFSFIHLDLYKMPYAFIAGIVMMLADIMSGSILPSLIIHLVNNTASVLLMKYAESQTFSIVFYSVAGVLVLVSLVFVFLRGRDYIARVRAAISGRMEYDRSVIVMAGMCIIYAVMNLFG
jgi:membrane protease YdiL (CAAX protease family)